MAESSEITPPDNTADYLPERPRYEPPMVVHLGSSQTGQGGEFCRPLGSADQDGCNQGPGFG